MPSSTLVQVINNATLVVKDQTKTAPTVEITTIGATTTIAQVINTLPATRVSVANPSVVLTTLKQISLVTNTQNSNMVVADVIPSPITVIPKFQPVGSVVINQGSTGPTGPQGPPGSGSGNVFIQDAAPGSPPAQYIWIQTNFPTAGNMTWWVNF